MELQKCKCSVLGCGKILKDPSEVAHGMMCNDCRDQLTVGKNVINLCWNCGAIIGIFEKPRAWMPLLGRRRSNILFSKGCRSCNHGIIELENAWMTIHKEERSENYIVGRDGLKFIGSRLFTLKKYEAATS